jgi:hypothetical protein
MRGRALSWSKIENRGPEANLPRLRSDPNFFSPDGVPDFRDDPLFSHLPFFPARALARFSERFWETNSVGSALDALPFTEPFEPGFLKSIVSLSNEAQFADLV